MAETFSPARPSARWDIPSLVSAINVCGLVPAKTAAAVADFKNERLLPKIESSFSAWFFILRAQYVIQILEQAFGCVRLRDEMLIVGCPGPSNQNLGDSFELYLLALLWPISFSALSSRKVQPQLFRNLVTVDANYEWENGTQQHDSGNQIKISSIMTCALAHLCD
ncbi:MAG: hypothetical protein JWM99_22 [Verrucomicrobiales bacterium]|nr:hypothetical protein [Verrucomicrobiales bacterium]